MSTTDREPVVPVVVHTQKDWGSGAVQVRVSFRCSNGDVCIPFSISEEEIIRSINRPTRLGMTTQELKTRLLISLQTADAREILGG